MTDELIADRRVEAERTTLSERDSLLMLDLLENLPPANAKLRAAIAAMPKAAGQL